MKDVKANERLQEIGKRWLGMSEDEKRQHNKRKDLMWTQYRKDLEKFKKVCVRVCICVHVLIE